MTKQALTRRNFLRAAGASAGGLVLTACEQQDPYALSKADINGVAGLPKGAEKRITSVAESGNGIRVRVVEGRAVKIEGHPGHLLSRGGLGPADQAGLQLLYHPDRITGPRKRVGPRGSGDWEPIGWDQALDEIAAELRTLREADTARGLVVVDGAPRGTTSRLWDRFLFAYGSPNHVRCRPPGRDAMRQAMKLMLGVEDTPGVDWENVRFALGFGSKPFADYIGPQRALRGAGMPADSRLDRPHVVQASTCFSAAALVADERVALEPASAGAVALGLAHVLVRDGLFDEEFARERGFGLESWEDAQGRTRQGFRELLERAYTPERVASLSGVSEAVLVDLAHDLAERGPSVVVADEDLLASSGGLGTAMSILALNALLGNIEAPGGLRVQRRAPLAEWPAVERDALARAQGDLPRLDGAGGPNAPLASDVPGRVPENLLAAGSKDVGAVFLHAANPVFTSPSGSQWIEALAKVPLVVSTASLPDESSMWADYLLPDHTYLERFEVVETEATSGVAVAGLREACVAPRHDTLPTGDVVIRLAQALGSPLSDAFPWKDARAANLARLDGLLTAGRGSTVASKMSQLVKGMRSDGGWWDLDSTREPITALATPSGRFEFASQELDRLLGSSAASPRDELCLPRWTPPGYASEAGSHPLVLVPYGLGELFRDDLRRLPFVRDLPLAGRRHVWDQVIELNPRDARRRTLEEGDTVVVESQAGSASFGVTLNEGVRPGTAGLRVAQGAWPPSAAAAAAGLFAGASDPATGIESFLETRIRIRKEQS